MRHPPLILGSIFFWCASPAWANIDYFFGAGTVHISRAGTISHTHNEFQGFLNPGFASFSEPAAGFAFVMNGLNAEPLRNVMLQHPSFPHAENFPKQGDLDFPEPVLVGLQTSMTLPILTQFEARKFRIHMNSFVPFGDTMFLGTKSTYIPSYVFYEGRNRHLGAHVSLSGVVIPNVLGVGGGVSASLRAASQMSLTMNAATNQVTSNSETRVTPDFSYFVGMYLHPLSWLHVSIAGYTSESWGFEFAAQSNAVIWKNTDVGIQVSGQSTFNFLPPRAILSTSAEIADNWILTPQLEYHVWSLYQTHRIRVQVPGTGINPTFPEARTEDIWVVRLGSSWRPWSWAAVHSGIGYMPSPIVGLSGIHNDVDTERIIGGLGLEFTGQNFLNPQQLSSHFRVGVFGQIHYLVPRTVTKLTDAIGSPGYELKGSAYVIGTQFSFDT